MLHNFVEFYSSHNSTKKLSIIHLTFISSSSKKKSMIFFIFIIMRYIIWRGVAPSYSQTPIPYKNPTINVHIQYKFVKLTKIEKYFSFFELKQNRRRKWVNERVKICGKSHNTDRYYFRCGEGDGSISCQWAVNTLIQATQSTIWRKTGRYHTHIYILPIPVTNLTFLHDWLALRQKPKSKGKSSLFYLIPIGHI